MNIAQSSLEELRYYFILSRDLEYLATSELSPDVDEVARLLGAYTQALLGPAS
jgi:four helix bundle protein